MLQPSVATTGRKISTESTPELRSSQKAQPTKREETPQQLVKTATTRNHTCGTLL